MALSTLRSRSLLRKPFTRAYSLTSTPPGPSALPNSPIFRALKKHDPSRPAISHAVSGKTFTYGDLLRDVLGFSRVLTERAGSDESRPLLEGRQTGIMADNGYPFVGRPVVLSFAEV